MVLFYWRLSFDNKSDHVFYNDVVIVVINYVRAYVKAKHNLQHQYHSFSASRQM